MVEAVCADTNPEVVKKSILEIRKVLGDRPDKPVFIETLRKRGYQFIAPVTDSRAAVRPASEAGSDAKIVGRETALARLDAHIERRSEEHTSELQSLRHLVCRLLLEKK